MSMEESVSRILDELKELREQFASDGKRGSRDGSQRLGHCRWTKKKDATIWSVHYLGADGELTFGKNVGCIFDTPEVAKRFAQKLNEVIDDATQ